MIRLALCLALLPVPALSQSLWQEGGSRVQTVIYRCDSAVDDLSVAYFTAPDSTSFAAVQIGGKVHALVQDVSGSGTRYVDVNQKTGYRLHGKGDDLLLLRQVSGQGGEEQLLASCSAQAG